MFGSPEPSSIACEPASEVVPSLAAADDGLNRQKQKREDRERRRKRMNAPTAIWQQTCRSGRLFVLLAPEHDVRSEVCGSGFHHAVAEDREIQALEHRLAPSEQDRRKRKVQFID
jgi:hypothetical protein